MIKYNKKAEAERKKFKGFLNIKMVSAQEQFRIAEKQAEMNCYFYNHNDSTESYSLWGRSGGKNARDAYVDCRSRVFEGFTEIQDRFEQSIDFNQYHIAKCFHEADRWKETDAVR